ncbi:MAG: hypothetical protein ABIJ09_03140 [Pseudomonadota bacterium]
MSRWFPAFLACCALHTASGCGMFTASTTANCIDDSNCPSGYTCHEGQCLAHPPVDSAVTWDALSVDGGSAERPGFDTRARDIWTDTPLAGDLLGWERPFVDATGRDGSASDVGASDRPESEAGGSDRSPADTSSGLDGWIADASVDAQHPDNGVQDTAADGGPAGDATSTCQDHSACPGSFCHPTMHTCETPTCLDGYLNGDETGIDCGGSCIGQTPPCNDGAGCSNHTDCSSDFCRPSDDTCQSPTCSDGFFNQDETDIDCGGVCVEQGPLCDNSDGCGADGDCLSGFCRVSTHTCEAPTCFDQYLNQDETDVDCGGSCVGQSPLCIDGQGCDDNGDCQNDFCRPADWTCRTPTCTDGFQNQDETGIDCGGITCAPCSTCWGSAANFDFDDGALVYSAAVDLTGCSPTINTSLAADAMLSNWCGPVPTPVVMAQTGGPDTVIVPMASLRIPATSTLRLVGNKPVVLAVRGDATVQGVIDVGAKGTTPGAGGDLSTDGSIATAGGAVGSGDCNLFATGTGQGVNREPGYWSLGGGGAGFRTNGGFGGGERQNFRCYKEANGYECKPMCPDAACDNSFIDSQTRFPANNSAHYAVVPIYGLAAPDRSLSPLRAGCAGGRGETRDSSTAYYGGSGGGALQLTVAGMLTVGAGGIISAAGGGGTVVGSHGSGSGGGSGGSIVLEATVIDLSAAAGVRAHGGSGGGRDGGGGCSGTAENGHITDDDYATHSSPASCVSEGRGGLSYWNLASPSCNGTGASIGSSQVCTLPVANWPTSATAYPQGGDFTDNNGGGGGGGSGGVIVVRRLVLSGACQ